MKENDMSVRSLGVALAAVTAALTGLLTADVTPAHAAAAVPQPLDASQFRLIQDDAGLRPATEALDTALATKKGW